MADTNGGKTVSLALYIATLVLAIVINAVAITAAILSRPTEEKVKLLIGEQFQEQSYLGQKLKNIDSEIGKIQIQLKEHQGKTEPRKD